MSRHVNYPRGSGRAVAQGGPEPAQDTSRPASDPGGGKHPPSTDTDAARVRRRNERIEDQEQAAYVAEVDAAIARNLPGADCIFSIPNANAAGPVVGQTLKETGRRAGVPDLLIAVPREVAGIRYAGCFLEMKRPAGSPSDVSPEQRAWLERLAAQGYMTVVVFGWREALALTQRYLGWDEV